MNYQIDKQTLIIKLQDKLIMNNSDKIKNEIKAKIDELVTKNNLDAVSIDLQDVEFIDSTGVGVFISIYKYVMERNLHLRLVHPRDIVSKVLTITKIGDIIEIVK